MLLAGIAATAATARSVSADVRYTFRALRRVPEFAAVAVLTLALGIGATAVVFAHVNNVLLKEVFVPRSERLIAIREFRDGEVERGVRQKDLGPLLARDFQSFESLTAAAPYNAILVTDTHSQQVSGEIVAGNYFSFLGVVPRLGRLLGPSDDTPGSDPTVVISETVWTSTFGAAPSVIGRQITLRGARYTVVGVLPRPSGDSSSRTSWRGTFGSRARAPSAFRRPRRAARRANCLG